MDARRDTPKTIDGMSSRLFSHHEERRQSVELPNPIDALLY